MTDQRPADSTDAKTDLPVGPSARLSANLGLFTAVTIVVGGVIGSGVFLKPGVIAASTHGYVGLILALWVGCGLVSLCGALAMAELSAMFPRAGGSYVFLNEAYGSLWGFLWAWAEFSVMRSGAIASLAAAMARTIHRIGAMAGHEISAGAQVAIAVGSVVGLTAVNIVGTRWGGGVQNVTTVIKVAFVAFLAALPFLAINNEPLDLAPLWPGSLAETGLLAGIGGALSGILWAYDGWAQLPVVAEEVRNAERNVPRALLIGLPLLIVLYSCANLAYHLTLTSQEMVGDGSVAVTVAKKLLPGFGEKLTLSMLVISVFGALNASILTGPRVLFAAARDHRALEWLRHVDPRFGTPAVAIAALSGWSVLLIVGAACFPHPQQGKELYDVLTDYGVFGASIFYLASVVAVFVLRVRRPGVARPYKALGYPVLPALFVAAYCVLLALMFWGSPFESTVGLSLIGLGALMYAIIVRLGQRPARTTDR